MEGTCGFTLAEVLIVLGIIGLIADMTIPTLMNKVESAVLKTQFKKAYSTLYNVVLQTKSGFGYDVNCFYWDGNPFGPAQCSATNPYGECISWTYNGGGLPPNYNGYMQECPAFFQGMMKNLNVSMYCPDNAYDKGCSPLYKSGRETAATGDPSGSYSISALRSTQAMYVISDGMIFMPWNNDFSMPNVSIDINGKKKPNKWGYDIFSFKISGDLKGKIKINGGAPGFVEQGGKSTNTMIVDVFK